MQRERRWIEPNARHGPEGEACEEDLDCAEELAQCHPQGVCTGALTSEALETECSEGNADICAGFACLVLNANAQGKTGLCTYKCESNADCGQGVCVELSGAGKVCLSPCQDSSDCSNGFVCVADPGEAVAPAWWSLQRAEPGDQDGAGVYSSSAQVSLSQARSSLSFSSIVPTVASWKSSA